VLIGAENYYVSAKRKNQQETPRRAHDQQHPCEECHQQKLSVRVQNEKKRDSTISEKEFHQPKLSVRVKKKS
jgi:hypothetical protein